MSGHIEHRRVTINGTSLHVAVSQPVKAPEDYISNARAQVLCIHGFPEGWLSWRPLMRLMPDVAFFAPDMRGYPRSAGPRDGYDVFTLTDDIDQLIDSLGLERPILLTHDWGGALGWLYGHRFSDRISHLMVVNCTHPRTLVRAVFRLQDFQAFRIPWVLPFQVPWLPEHLIANPVGRKLLELSFTLREGSAGSMDHDLTREIVRRFDTAGDMRGAIEYYRYFVRTLLFPDSRRKLAELYRTPIRVPVTLIWGLEDGALSARVARESHRDAGCPVDWRPLPGIGHFVDLEAPELLARELDRVLEARGQPPATSAPRHEAA
ncbi:alpha/beta fold hydrolase [Marinobacter sp. OP 3.4]|uniref:alpha/beta fold hydrolase n=1 Tax=Marinobacter sp. OP 3.4 TaxID=3076501 RepID=UPI002E1CCE84